MGHPGRWEFERKDALANARGFPETSEVAKAINNMSDDEQEALYKRARKTATRLALAGRLHMLPVDYYHIAYGRYGEYYAFHVAPRPAKPEGDAGSVSIMQGYMLIETFKESGDINHPNRVIFAVNPNNGTAFARWNWWRQSFEALSDWDSAAALLNCDRTLGLFDHRDVGCIAFYNVACKLRAKRLRDEFKNEIAAAQEREVSKAIKGTRLYFDAHARHRLSRQIAAGAYSAVKNEIRNAKRYRYSSKNFTTTQEHARQQLRALGIVA